MILGIKKFTPFALSYPRYLFCGSFNPLHHGHTAIVKFVEDNYHSPVDFEISLANVEKHHIDMAEVDRRFQQMRKHITPAFGKLYITEDARYLEKARLFPEVTFICGFDTIQALCAGVYYRGDEFNQAMDEFEELGIRWIAFHRRKSNGEVSTEEDFANFPDKLRKCLTIVSREDFPNMDVSSRGIRNAQDNYRVGG